MNTPKTGRLCAFFLLCLGLICATGFAQVARQPAPLPDNSTKMSPAPDSPQQQSGASDGSSETLVLSPFEVRSQQDDSYTARDTLAGNRVRTNLSDVGSSVQVVTKKLLDDTGSRTAADLLSLLTNTEVAGQGGNFIGQGNGGTLTGTPSLTPTTRVRGVNSADLTQDFFLTRIPFDTYNTSRVDVQRGPNSILFGIGSPGGIINSSTNGAQFADTNKVENQVGSFGSIRTSVDFNRAVLPNELAVRVSALYDDTKYRETPAFRDDHRIYGALRWEPAFVNKGSAHTSFTVNAERGKIDGNAPLTTPPLDSITPFFTSPNFKDSSGKLRTYSTVQDPNALLASNPWLSENAAGSGLFNNTAFEAGGGQGASFYGDAFDWPNTSPAKTIQGLYRMMEIADFATYATNAALPGSDLGAYKAKSLTDPSIFNFYNKLLYGPNAGENDNFNTITANLSQTFFNNRLGFSLAYNRQFSRYSNWALLSADETALSVDVVNTLPDGQPNPNVGRPLVIAGPGNGSWSDETRDTIRLTGFAELNFKDFLAKDSWIARILGRHVITGLIDRYSLKTDNRGYQATYIAPDPNNWQSISPGDAVSSATETAFVYLAPSVTNQTGAAGLNLGGITGPINYQPITMPEYNNVLNQIVNAPLNVINNRIQPDESKLYSSATLQRNIVNSRVITWQGYLFDGALVPLVGYRTDTESSYVKQAPSLQGTSWVDLTNYRLPSAATANAKGHSDTYSVVAHIPNSLRAKLPGRLDISPFYNQSENFQPSAGRVDIYGNPLQSPSGKTKEYGVTLSVLDDKLSLKITHYKTSAANVTIADGGALASNLLVSYGWGESQYLALTNPTVTTPFSSFQRVNEGTTSGGQTLYFQPPGSAPYTQAQIDAEYQVQQTILNAWAAHAQLPASIVSTNGMTNYGNAATYASAFTAAAGLAVTADTSSQGMEFELSANPIAGLNVSFNAAHTTATETNIAKTFTAFYNQSADLFLKSPAGDMTLFGPGPWTAKTWFQQFAVPQYNLFVAEQGADVPELRPWHFNAIGDYAFQKGSLKGFHVGGDYRWESGIVTGYPIVQVNGADTFDVQHPYRGSTLGKVDLWLGYSKRVRKNYLWRTQINVRNLLATDKLNVVTVQPDGSPAAKGIPEPRVIYWTNTLEF